jgi:hypothetical protein
MIPDVGIAECTVLSTLSHNITVIAPQELTTISLSLPQLAQVLWQYNACHRALNPTIKATNHKCSSWLHVQCHSMSICRGRRWANNLNICKIVQISHTQFCSLVCVLILQGPSFYHFPSTPTIPLELRVTLFWSGLYFLNHKPVKHQGTSMNQCTIWRKLYS